jgi:hypothetical protein
MKLKSIREERQKLVDRIAKLDALENKLLSQKTIRCCDSNYGKGCGAKTKIKNITYIQTLYYVDEAYNEHWENGEGQFDCPKCGLRNRLIDIFGQKGREKFCELKYLFKNIIEKEK